MANVMTKRGSLDNNVTYEHYCDSAADLPNIPPNILPLVRLPLSLMTTAVWVYIWRIVQNNGIVY